MADERPSESDDEMTRRAVAYLSVDVAAVNAEEDLAALMSGPWTVGDLQRFFGLVLAVHSAVAQEVSPSRLRAIYQSFRDTTYGQRP